MVGDDDSSACDKIASQILLTEKKLKNIETRHHLAQRWEPESVQYQIVKKAFTTKTRSNLLIKSRIWQGSTGFYLLLKPSMQVCN